MRSKILALLTTASVFLVGNRQCLCFERLEENERVQLRELALNNARLLLAQRVHQENPEIKAPKSLNESLKTEAGREELKSLSALLWNYTETAYRGPSNRYECAIEGKNCLSFDYFSLYHHKFFSALEALSSSGLLHKWPRYYYDRNTSEIVILPEEISVKARSSAHDYGPPLPDFEKVHALTRDEIMNETGGIHENNRLWYYTTPEDFEDPKLYELNHVMEEVYLFHYWSISASCSLLCGTSRILKQNRRWQLRFASLTLRARDLWRRMSAKK